MSPDELVAQITAATFPLTRLRVGYDVGDVDQFLEDVAAAVRSGVDVTDLRRMVSEVTFATTSLREGYEMTAVDDFCDVLLNGAAPDVQDGNGSQDGTGPQDVPDPLSGTDPRDAMREPAAPQDMAVDPAGVHDTPSAVVENPPQGLLGRLFGRR